MEKPRPRPLQLPAQRTGRGGTAQDISGRRERVGRRCSAKEDEFRYEHIKGTTNIPLSRLGPAMANLPANRNIMVLCQTGARTQQAVAELKQAGFDKIFPIDGGLRAWKSAGFPTVKSGEPIPIMRQVQILAGPRPDRRIVFPIEMGGCFRRSGIDVSGISGFCGMAVLLSKLPWNKRIPPAACLPSGQGSCAPCGNTPAGPGDGIKTG